MIGHYGLVIVPPAGQGKGFGCFLAVNIKGQCKLLSQFGLDSKQGQYPRIGSGFVSSFGGKPSFNGLQKHPFSIVCVAVAYFNMAFVKWHFVRHTDKTPCSILLYKRIAFKLVILLLG